MHDAEQSSVNTNSSAPTSAGKAAQPAVGNPEDSWSSLMTIS